MPRSRVRSERGAAAVEFALVVPLLLLLLFAIISYGYLLSFRQALSQGASEAARAAVVDLDANSGGADVTAVIDGSLDSYGVTCASAAMTCEVSDPAPCGAGGEPLCVTVTLTYDYDADPLVPPLPGLGLVLPDRLSYTAVVRAS